MQNQKIAFEALLEEIRRSSSSQISPSDLSRRLIMLYKECRIETLK